MVSDIALELPSNAASSPGCEPRQRGDPERGGGYDAPADRDPAFVQAGLRDGKIGIEAARAFYGDRGNE
jgi:hypothetical protein